MANPSNGVLTDAEYAQAQAAQSSLPMKTNKANQPTGKGSKLKGLFNTAEGLIQNKLGGGGNNMPSNQPTTKSNTGLYIGIGVAVVVVLVIIFVVMKKK